MRKVLVLTLVLVLAFASSAMAAVSFSGKFTAKFEQKSFKLGVDPYSLEPTLEFTISASNKNVTTIGEDEEAEEIVNWDFSAGLNLETRSSSLVSTSSFSRTTTSQPASGATSRN